MEKWITYRWSDKWWNKNIQNFPSITVTGHFPSKSEIRLSGSKEEMEAFLKLASEWIS
jgi:hypothetical protein